MCVLSNRGNDKINLFVVDFINKDNRLSPSPILQYVLEIDQPFDTVICCGDGKLGAHRLVLAAASAFLSKLFEDHVRLHLLSIV